MLSVVPTEAKRSGGTFYAQARSLHCVSLRSTSVGTTETIARPIRKGRTVKRTIKPVHPGRILRDEFMEPGGISQYRLAQATGLSQVQVGNIVRGRRGITAETALRLERALGMSAQTWMNLQTLYELEKATLEAGRRIKQTTERLKLRDAA
ncbi:MAG: HigA family addiction module antidote protein [Reyranella sp.]|nr:HigA family addiction module antidote protein [Reyranella sp.]